MSMIADKVREMPFSGIRKFFDVAAEMEDVISLGVGEPDFFTPWNVRESAIFYLEKRRTTYSSNAGMMELRREICTYYKRRFNLSYDPKTQSIVTVGGSEGIDLCMRALLNPGDEVLVVEPCFVAYKPCVIMAGGVPVVVDTRAENNFKLTPEDIIPKITKKTKAIIFGYPTNPTGAIMEHEDYAKIVPILADAGIVAISDEIYAELTYGGRKHASIAHFPEMYDKTVIINGFSKSYAMTGWRLGYALGSEEIISAMTKIHQYCIMCAPTVSQYAGIEALRNCDTAVDNMRKDYDARRRTMLKGFSDLGIPCFEPLGAFYLFPCIKASNLSSEEFCNRLLYEERLAVVPGTAFGDSGEGFVRCSYAYSIDELKAALERFGNFIQKFF